MTQEHGVSTLDRCERCGGPKPNELLTCSLEGCPYSTGAPLREWGDPLFTSLCTLDSVREALDAPTTASPILVRCLADALDQAWRDYSRLLVEYERTTRERDAVYGELNKALGAHAPKAWDRIKEASRV